MESWQKVISIVNHTIEEKGINVEDSERKERGGSSNTTLYTAFQLAMVPSDCASQEVF